MERNTIVALLLTVLLIFGYDAIVVKPQRDAYQQAQSEQQEAARQEAAAKGESFDPADTGETIFTGTDAAMDRQTALLQAPGRVPIDTPAYTGSINLRGLMFDDLTLKNYHATYDDDSPRITLLSPQTLPEAQFLHAGIRLNGQNDVTDLWRAPEGAVLRPGNPVTFTRQEAGVTQEVTVAVDEQFMFKVTQRVRNDSGAPVSLQPYAGAYQKALPPDLQNFMILFEGPLAVTSEQGPWQKKYKKLVGMEPLEHTGIGGWAGLTDKYWLSAAIPPQDQAVQVTIAASDTATPYFRSTWRSDPEILPAGQTYENASLLFAGAKRVEILRDYQEAYGIQRFIWAVDWGNFSFLTRPIFATLSFFHGLTGNWGVAILLLTLVIKAILFPLANLSYKSMAGMKKVQPEMQKIKERYKDDQAKQQQEMMGLYKKYKINPAAGCLPIVAQMPIFYALYKTLFVTIELRHEPFLYIRDLSEQDPTTVFNLFGLLPYDPAFVPVIGPFIGSLGILPLLMGAAMYVQQKLNPPPPDPTQRRIFALMPLAFMFIFAPFAAGLVLYWFWNTFLSVIQQYVIMKRQGADVDILGNIKQSFRRGSKPANENARS